MYFKRVNLIFYYFLLFFIFNNTNCMFNYFLNKIENISNNSKLVIKNNFNKSLSLFSKLFNKFNNVNGKVKNIFNNSKPVINDGIKNTINISYCSLLAFYAVGISIVKFPKTLLDIYTGLDNIVIDKTSYVLNGVMQQAIENLKNNIEYDIITARASYVLNGVMQQAIENLKNNIEYDIITARASYVLNGVMQQAIENLKNNIEYDIITARASYVLNGVMQQAIKNLNNSVEKGEAGEIVHNLSKKLDEGLRKLTVVKDFNNGYKKAVYLTTASLISIIPAYFIFKYLYKSYNKPSLIIESSIESFDDKIKNFILGKNQVNLNSMYYNKDLSERLSDIVKSVISISESIKNGVKNIKYNNLFLYGPPGVGKTMFAKELAKRSGMDYVLLSGASFSQFKDGKGITEMNELFKWANKSSKGLLIIIDEADTFLYKREKMEPNSKEYQLLNNFLNHTGNSSDKFMIVLCANYKDVMDEAVFSRIADYVAINLPDEKERQGVLILYRNKILLNSEENTKEFIDSVNRVLNDNKIRSIAKLTNNFSNRDLMYLINTMKVMSNIKPEKVLTENIVDIAVERAIAKHNHLYKI